MNVLSMGAPFGADYSPVRLFRSRHGHKVKTLAAEGRADYTPDEPPASTPDYTFSADETAVEVVARIAAGWGPDMLICWLPELFPPPRGIEHCPIKTAAIISDWNLYFAQIRDNLSRYDVVLTDKLGARSLRLRGAAPKYLFPLYSQRTPIHRKMDVTKDIDVLFAGNLNHAIHARRGRCLEQVASLSDRYRVVLCTGHFHEAYTRLLNRARIVFNHSLRSEMNLRCFEALACNALLFLEEDNLEVRDLLRDREEMVLYRPENLVELIEYYLEHSGERERITRQGHARAASLAGENRLDTLIDWLANQPMGDRAFHVYPEPDRAFADVMQYTSSLVLDQRALAERDLARCAERYPDRPEFVTVSASLALSRIGTLGDAERKQATQDILARFNKACALAPKACTFWLNLALVCRGNTPAEPKCLALALEAPSCDYGGLLMGDVTDPYYVAWRRALASGAERVEMLWAQAATRLAALYVTQGGFNEARDWAAKAIEWLPGVARPYHVRATAERRLGNVRTAADILAQGLALTAFDDEYRMGLVDAWLAVGDIAEARRLAADSARLFDACPGSADQTQAFREIFGQIDSPGWPQERDTT